MPMVRSESGVWSKQGFARLPPQFNQDEAMNPINVRTQQYIEIDGENTNLQPYVVSVAIVYVHVLYNASARHENEGVVSS